MIPPAGLNTSPTKSLLWGCVVQLRYAKHEGPNVTATKRVGGVFKSAAVEVLLQQRELLTTGRCIVLLGLCVLQGDCCSSFPFLWRIVKLRMLRSASNTCCAKCNSVKRTLCTKRRIRKPSLQAKSQGRRCHVACSSLAKGKLRKRQWLRRCTAMSRATAPDQRSSGERPKTPKECFEALKSLRTRVLCILYCRVCVL